MVAIVVKSVSVSTVSPSSPTLFCDRSIAFYPLLKVRVLGYYEQESAGLFAQPSSSTFSSASSPSSSSSSSGLTLSGFPLWATMPVTVEKKQQDPRSSEWRDHYFTAKVIEQSEYILVLKGPTRRELEKTRVKGARSGGWRKRQPGSSCRC